MNWNRFNTYGNSEEKSYENLCNQLFERYLQRLYGDRLSKFKVINGAGGDGGIEAYGELVSGDVIAIQAKWFRNILKDPEIVQIKNSLETAISLRPKIKTYIVCIPHNVSSLKYGRGKKGQSKRPIKNYEEKTIDKFTGEVKHKYPNLELVWWFEKDIEFELQQANNDGIHKFWFEKELISLEYLQTHFNFQKKGWLSERYVPELHGQGIIHEEYQVTCFTKQFRENLSEVIGKVLLNLVNCLSHINKFIEINHKDYQINSSLLEVRKNLQVYETELIRIREHLLIGNDYFIVKSLQEIDFLGLLSDLTDLKVDNLQKGVLPNLISSLDKIYKYDFPTYIEDLTFLIKEKIKLVLGEPGTGKTHGLSNCIDIHLASGSPALIIQAKRCPCNNWTEILSTSLELYDWNKSEILVSLESLALRRDIQEASLLDINEDLKKETTKVLICVDGLEEDAGNMDDWYSRMRECEELVKIYPRVRFIFSARTYFLAKEKEVLQSSYKKINLPREGDIPIREIAEKYFNDQYYNIKVSSFSIIKGIDNLFALRLFCENYRNSTLTNSDQIVTATNELLNLKIDKINREFLRSLDVRKGNTRNPVLDSLIAISEYFFSHVEAEHEKLVQTIGQLLGGYLDIGEIDRVIDFLTDYGLLIRTEKIVKDSALKRSKFVYNVAYQSIIEYIIAQKIYNEIINGRINQIPDIFRIKRQSHLERIEPEEQTNWLKNQRIIQEIVDELFLKNGKLIGKDGFLTTGFDGFNIFKMQMSALMKAPESLAKDYENRVKSMINGDFDSFYMVLKYLILPSCSSNNNYFGSEYLHEILINQKSAFQRDKLWSGMDKYELGVLQEDKRKIYEYNNITTLIQGFHSQYNHIMPSQKHNEIPLLYAWGLSSINQHLRHELRVVLTNWGLENTNEFLLLLDKVFFCNDPQIQEDLASIVLGLASLLKIKNDINSLARWALDNIFYDSDKYRNVIVRQGFRAIIERAFQNGLISWEEVSISRPKLKKEILLVPVKEAFLKRPKKEFYPIVHDLAWYVIDKSYDTFFKYPMEISGILKSEDCQEAVMLLDEYRTKHPNIFGRSLAMAAALKYIESLGFTRKEGNWTTDATHGSKSKVFTYEEKYAWLAVHYLLGYFSDYIPREPWSGDREPVYDYSLLTYIPNPGEYLENGIKTLSSLNNKWIIKETLSKEIEKNLDIRSAIIKWVHDPPEVSFKDWIFFDSSEIGLEKETRNWMALYNRTGLYDSNEICFTYIDIRACLIKKDNFDKLKETIYTDPDSLSFLTHFDGIRSIPKTHTYCNLSDIVWMTWLEEDEKHSYFYSAVTKKRIEILHTIIRGITNTLEGEEYWMLPSKIIRSLLGVYTLSGNELRDAEGKTLSVVHKVSEGSYRNNQELVLVDFDNILKLTQQKEYEIVWFVELLKEKNPLNESLPKDFHALKTRKYFVYMEEGILKSYKFWDEKYSNQRDFLEEAGDVTITPPPN